jgi:hypothetical protein
MAYVPREARAVRERICECDAMQNQKINYSFTIATSASFSETCRDANALSSRRGGISCNGGFLAILRMVSLELCDSFGRVEVFCMCGASSCFELLAALHMFVSSCSSTAWHGGAYSYWRQVF